MNILFLTHQGGPAGSTYSIYYLAKGLADRGHRVVVGCTSTSLLYKLLEHTAVERIAMTFKRRLDFTNMRQIRDVVRKYDIQLINAQSGKDRYTSIFANWLFRLNIPIIHTRRQTPKSSGMFLQNWLYVRGTEKIVAVSSGVRDALIELRLPEDHITVIHNGTPRNKYALKYPSMVEELRHHHNVQPEEKVIGCVSRKKQQEQLLQALSLIDRPLRVFFIGVEQRDEYTEIIRSFSAPHQVHFLGHVEQEQVLYYYKMFDIKVLPSVTEGLSQALLEAMAMGIPVIATAAAGNLDLIRDGENGLLFKPGDVQGLARQITDLLQDKVLRARLIKKARYTALHEFSIDQTVRNYENFFESTLRSYYGKSEYS